VPNAPDTVHQGTMKKSLSSLVVLALLVLNLSPGCLGKGGGGSSQVCGPLRGATGIACCCRAILPHLS
jgi:hypothetical protein